MTHGVGTVDSGEMSRFLCSRLVGYARLCPETSTRYACPLGSVPREGSPPGLWKWNFWEPGSPLSSCTAPPSWQGVFPGVARGAADRSFLSGLAHRCPVWAASAGSCGAASNGTTARPDEEEKAFIPTLHENLEIKVVGPGAGAGRAGRGGSRGRGAHTHHLPSPCDRAARPGSSLAVGAVTCDITDFFTTRPQVIVVDITELGTIKPQPECCGSNACGRFDALLEGWGWAGAVGEGRRERGRPQTRPPPGPRRDLRLPWWPDLTLVLRLPPDRQPRPLSCSPVHANGLLLSLNSLIFLHF